MPVLLPVFVSYHREVPMVDRRKISFVGREVSKTVFRILAPSSIFHVLYGSLFLPQTHSAISSRKTPQREQFSFINSDERDHSTPLTPRVEKLQLRCASWSLAIVHNPHYFLDFPALPIYYTPMINSTHASIREEMFSAAS
ncbi:hypothetical protein PAAG_11832 [Paracoccidioides lutzii Pb01]|uniref:Uncharacterized protein n=1 Tax=Paracoccidioides lutzii (strain ATCC MYA-826 / Pb01) TaxID=502779 RepID=A0A0A2V539_PARBA|nr:hypothetical protein PAAG_11832 [Paracoccidioides lutzii Pb01]KGQ01482.1 hypothetical protein PAAG_11832 [Paracoccidioides lutzii Pb01]